MTSFILGIIAEIHNLFDYLTGKKRRAKLQAEYEATMEAEYREGMIEEISRLNNRPTAEVADYTRQDLQSFLLSLQDAHDRLMRNLYSYPWPGAEHCKSDEALKSAIRNKSIPELEEMERCFWWLNEAQRALHDVYSSISIAPVAADAATGAAPEALKPEIEVGSQVVIKSLPQFSVCVVKKFVTPEIVLVNTQLKNLPTHVQVHLNDLELAPMKAESGRWISVKEISVGRSGRWPQV